MLDNPHLLNGLNVHRGKVTYADVARDLGYEVVVDNLARSDLYIAEEAFVCATAAEVSSVNPVDDRALHCPGDKTVAIAEVYHRTVRGEEPRYKDWCELAR